MGHTPTGGVRIQMLGDRNAVSGPRKPNGAAACRLGIVVSKRVIPRAAVRSYCKRLAREVFRVECRELAGVDFVVRPRAAVTPALSAAARAEIRDLLHRAQGLSRVGTR
jgi:ribonuclease P protein component